LLFQNLKKFKNLYYQIFSCLFSFSKLCGRMHIVNAPTDVPVDSSDEWFCVVDRAAGARRDAVYNKEKFEMQKQQEQITLATAVTPPLPGLSVQNAWSVGPSRV
jgi:hypothetical protein